MKKIFLLMAVLTITAGAMANDSIAVTRSEEPLSVFYQNADENFILYPTQNMYIFILLDTRNGRLELVQWNTKLSSRTRFTLSSQSHIGYDEEEIPGRFILTPTTNQYNFIMLDKLNGRTWQVQWSTNPKEHKVLEIY